MADPSGDASVAAILAQRSREDRDALLDDLVAYFSEALPGAQVKRSLFRRQVTSVRLPVGETAYVLSRGAGSGFECSRQHVVRGVALRSDPMEIDAFLAELGDALDAELKRTERGRSALRQWLGGSTA